MRTDDDFLRGLVARHQALKPLLTEHLDDMDGELAPHLLMADIQRWVEHSAPEDASAAAVVDDLDRALATALETGDTDVENVITVSFLEYWPPPPEPGSGWRQRFPEHLRARLAELES